MLMLMRRTHTIAPTALGLLAATVLAGCGSSSPSANPSVTTTSMSPSSTPTTPFQRQSPSMSPTATGAVDLHITNSIRAELVAAGAKEKSLTASDFTGLQPGQTYYAYDAATHTYWAGASLVPSSSSMNAQVSVQDDGGYTLFHRSSTGPWVAMDSALAGPNGPQGAKPCGVTPPADVLISWGWPAHSCHPTGI